MPAYVMITSDVHDPERIGAQYGPVAQATLAKVGGRVLAAGSRQLSPEGGILRSRNLLLELPDLDAAQRWYADPDYQAVHHIRDETSTTSAVAVAGLDAVSTLGGAFVLGTLDLTDPARFQHEYLPPTLALIVAHGGRMLIAGGDSVALCGNDFLPRNVVFEFQDLDTARAWYDDPEYAPLIKLRRECTQGDLVIVSGD
jgi:uncharacterized protein (DUF1330 family)